jgi:hypothetical protein
LKNVNIFNTLEIHFLIFRIEFHEGTYTPLWGVRPLFPWPAGIVEIAAMRATTPKRDQRMHRGTPPPTAQRRSTGTTMKNYLML